MTDRRIHQMPLYEQAFSEYFDAIFSPFKPYVQSGLSKLGALDADTVCTSHGPVLHKDGFLEEAMARYNQWSTKQPQAQKHIPIFFCSAYSNTGKLAEKIAEGIRSVLRDADVTIYDLTVTDPVDLTEQLNSADAFLLGSPTINKDALPPVWQLVSSIDAINSKGKPAAVFGSYGWSGEGVPAVIGRLKAMNMAVFEEGYRCRFVPSEAELQGAFEFGARFAASL
jgi:flavorubredoxin